MFLALGFLAGTLGTMIGVGGGFLLVPTLLFLYPEAPSAWITGVSLWLVAVNASSGSIAYARKKRVHWQAALLFLLFTLPGTFLGVWAETQMPRLAFDKVFGAVLGAYAVFLLVRKRSPDQNATMTPETPLDARTKKIGSWISFLVGAVASFLGLGGGVIHVPLMSQVLKFPVHLATGTSHVILAGAAIVATLTHLWHGTLDLREPIFWQLGVGAAVGAQLGAYLSSKVSGALILKLLAVALLSVSVRLLL